jgi:hypothetical protein
MKIAHLVLAHNNPLQLEKLVRRLTYADDAVYIHLDKKTPVNQFEYLKKLKNVFLINKRVEVQWGAHSMVTATINSYEEIINSGIKYDFVNLLSGCDYPLQKPDYIHDFFNRHKGKAFMSFIPLFEEWHEAVPRITRYHLNGYKFPGRYMLQNLLNSILPKRTMPYGLVPVGRSQWFTASAEAVAYLLDYWKQHGKLRRFVKLCWGADEFVFQTILYNSPYREQIVNDNLRHIDWSAGGASPKIFTVADKNQLLSSDKLFARKFDLIEHADIMQVIDEKLDSQNQQVLA